MARIRKMEFDGVIVGGGGAGMRAALQLAQSGLKTAVISKVFPDPLAHGVGPGRHHLRDCAATTRTTIGAGTCTTPSRGRTTSGPGRHRVHVQRGPAGGFELEHMGLPFSRTETGASTSGRSAVSRKIIGKGGQAARTCAAADRPGTRCCIRSTRPISRQHDVLQRVVRRRSGQESRTVVVGVIAI